MNAPICAVCGRRVDRFTVAHSPECRWTEFVAECHGNTEKVVITQQMLEQMPSGVGIHVLRAFESDGLALEQP